MRSKYHKFMDEHGLKDGLLRELCKSDDINVDQVLHSIEDATKKRYSDLQALKQLFIMVKDANNPKDVVTCSIEENCDE